MRLAATLCSVAVLSFACAAPCQETPKGDHVPIYDVTVIERTTKAINYAYRGGATKIDFRGTILLPQAKGEATVESLRGRTEVDAKFENLLPTTRFGHEYLTYSLWAITPEGAAHNIGEIVPDGSNKAKLHVTTELQAFGLIVTAEPYSATRKPSDVVVMENQVRPDTVGKIEQINAKYELLPRGRYTWEVPAALQSGVSGAPKVSMNEYEAILELYEAQNAVGIARAAGADQYAHDTLANANTLLEQARHLQMSKAPTNVVVETARESAQTAEDARVLTDRRRSDEKVATAQREVSQARQVAAQAETAASQARAEADTQRAQAQADRQARDRAEADAADARATLSQAKAAPPPVVAQIVRPNPKEADDARKADARMRLHQDLSSALPTLDSPRGLIATIPDADFNGSELTAVATAQLARIVAVLAPNPDLRIDVEGYSDTAAGATYSELRADSVRRFLVNRGIMPSRVTASGLGDARPVASNATPSGRTTNRRVEIVITGDSIGEHAAWDRTYSLVPGR